MPEKLPPFERPKPAVVGSGSVEEKDQFKKFISARFGEQHYDALPEKVRAVLEGGGEYKKTPLEEKIIEIGNLITNQLLKKAGQQEFDIPITDIHFLPKRIFGMVASENSNGETFLTEQAIAINTDLSRDVPIWHAQVVLHEMVHLKGYSAFELGEGEAPKIHRSGLRATTTRKNEKRFGDFEMFRWLNEAVVTEIVKDYLPKFTSYSEPLDEDAKWMNSSEAEKIKEKRAEEIGIDKNEFFYVSKDGSMGVTQPYIEQRKIFRYIVEAISEDLGIDQAEVKEKFFNAHFNGSLAEIDHLIEGTFGKGSFEVLSLTAMSEGEIPAMLKYLNKHRRITRGSAGK